MSKSFQPYPWHVFISLSLNTAGDEEFTSQVSPFHLWITLIFQSFYNWQIVPFFCWPEQMGNFKKMAKPQSQKSMPLKKQPV